MPGALLTHLVIETVPTMTVSFCSFYPFVALNKTLRASSCIIIYPSVSVFTYCSLVITNVFFSSSRRERSKVPYIVRQCLEEIERRGMEEVGIYRVSGVATDIQALKTAFDTSKYSPYLYTVYALSRQL